MIKESARIWRYAEGGVSSQLFGDFLSHIGLGTNQSQEKFFLKK
jgi:hypothetical protein